jgi:hypothetical protein
MTVEQVIFVSLLSLNALVLFASVVVLVTRPDLVIKGLLWISKKVDAL